MPMTLIRNRRYLFEQQLKPELWDWSEEDKKLFEDYQTNRDVIFRKIYDRLCKIDKEDDGSGKMEVALVIHDKDVSYDTKLVEPHIHAYIDFKRQVVLNRVATALGLEKERIEKPKTKGGPQYSRINALAYLIHAKDKDKYQYPVEDVETFGTIDYETFIKQNKEGFEKFAATRKREKTEESLDLIYDKVVAGELTEDDILEDEQLRYLWSHHQQKFDEAFKAYGKIASRMTLKAIEKGEFQPTILYIHGQAGAGKTFLANEIMTRISDKAKEQGFKWNRYDAGTKNIFDEYFGEELILLDDPRYDSLLPSDWLKLLDPLNKSYLSARYKNKLVVGRLIIMTNYLSLAVFFGQIPREDLNQYLRRFHHVIDIQRRDDGKYYKLSEMRPLSTSQTDLHFGESAIITTQDKEEFLDKLLEEYIYPRILPQEEKISKE